MMLTRTATCHPADADRAREAAARDERTTVSEEAPLPRIDRVLELVAVLLLGITTVGTAWCGYQSTQWNTVSGNLTETAAAQRLEGSRLFGLATQEITYDSMVVAKYAEAVQAHNTGLEQFYRRSVVRPAFLPYLDRWEAAERAGKPNVGVFEDKRYLDGQFAGYRRTVAAAERADRQSSTADQLGQEYVGATILLAVSLFFAGVTSSFRSRLARVLLLIAATGVLVLAAVRIAGLPIT
jgi:hypothetical protein